MQSAMLILQILSTLELELIQILDLSASCLDEEHPVDWIGGFFSWTVRTLEHIRFC